MNVSPKSSIGRAVQRATRYSARVQRISRGAIRPMTVSQARHALHLIKTGVVSKATLSDDSSNPRHLLSGFHEDAGRRLRTLEDIDRATA